MIYPIKKTYPQSNSEKPEKEKIVLSTNPIEGVVGNLRTLADAVEAGRVATDARAEEYRAYINSYTYDDVTRNARFGTAYGMGTARLEARRNEPEHVIEYPDGHEYRYTGVSRMTLGQAQVALGTNDCGIGTCDYCAELRLRIRQLEREEAARNVRVAACPPDCVWCERNQ